MRIPSKCLQRCEPCRLHEKRRTITFRVEARDEIETIGGGTHQRVVVSVDRFDERVQRKVRGLSVGA